jgi:hypothetical protein
MRLLVVAPGSNLQVNVEIIAAAANARTTTLNGHVPKRELLGHIESGDYDGIHFAAHGTPYSVQMSDETVYDSELQSAFDIAARKGKPVRIVLLNTCRSLPLAIRFHSMGTSSPRYVIGWRDDVEDEVAGEFAKAFWSKAYPDCDVHQTFDLAIDEIRHRFPAHELPNLINGMRTVIQDLIEQVQLLRRASDKNVADRLEFSHKLDEENDRQRHIMYLMGGFLIAFTAVLFMLFVLLLNGLSG